MPDEDVLIYSFPDWAVEVAPDTAEGLEDEGMVEPDGMGGYEVVGDLESVKAFIREQD